MAGCRANTQKLKINFSEIVNRQLEDVIKEEVSFTVVTTRITYLETNFKRY